MCRPRAQTHRYRLDALRAGGDVQPREPSSTVGSAPGLEAQDEERDLVAQALHLLLKRLTWSTRKARSKVSLSESRYAPRFDTDRTFPFAQRSLTGPLYCTVPPIIEPNHGSCVAIS